MADLAGARDKRPTPEAMLARVQRESAAKRRGRLKVFLGAAPGVGKTYAMLSAAKQAKTEGIDVVAGVVETHGRSETETMLAGLDVLPRKAVEYNKHTLTEFDIDAALARRPALVLVDELAHSNPPTSRHPKRYMDVEELLNSGIDVWTTMNIQHLESLSDVVSRITGIVVRERVPDTVLEQADEIVVVDITPDDLIQRLKEGKVYLPDNARRAIDNFFKPGNLTALRELALRRTAEQVDDEMLSLLRENEIEGPWPTADRLLVLVGSDARSETVLRTASRMAKGMKASLVAIHLERPGSETTDQAELKRLDDILRLARRLGAETSRLSAQDLPAELLRYARRENITQIVMGRSGADWLARLRGRSLTDEVLRRAHDVAVLVVTEGASDRSAPLFRLPNLSSNFSVYATAIASVGGTVCLGMVLQSWFNLPNLSMLFLTAVLYCALSQGVTSAITAAFLSFFAYNFFFIPPIYSFTVAEPHELFALVIFLIVAVFTGGLAGRVREQSDAIRRRNASTQRLYEFSRKLSGASKFDDLLVTVTGTLAASVDGTAIVLLDDGKDLAIKAAWPPEDQLGTADLAAARWASTHREVAGHQTSTLPSALFQFRPLVASRGVVGVVGLQPKSGMNQLPSEVDRVLAAMLEQTAIAIERAQLSEETMRAQAMVESERLRSALLSSISHDLRTPLASIVGSVTSLRTLGQRMSEAARSDLLATIEEEAARLSRFVSNLLDMTRLEAGALELKREWIDIGDVVREAAKAAGRSFPKRATVIDLPRDLPLVRGDPKLLVQVIFNLLDNADKYTERETATVISAFQTGSDVVIYVTDQGIGIPEADHERVFEKFYRVASGDGRAAGTGLGLSICRGVIVAMGGSIVAESPVHDGRGTRIVIRLPAVLETAAAPDGIDDKHERTTS